MMKQSSYVALIVSLVALAGIARAGVSERPDHTIFVTIESDQPGVEILSVPSDADGISQKLGTTPHVAVVELRWEHAVLGKLWRTMKVWTPGDICQSRYDQKARSYDLTMKFLAARDGVTNSYELPLTSFEYVKDVDYDKLDFIPSRRTLSFTWNEPAGKKSGAAESKDKVRVRTVMMAKAGQGSTQFGAVTVVATVPEAEVFVDGASAGLSPVRVVLSEGDHQITVEKKGHKSWSASIPVKPSGEERLTAALEPAP